MTCEIKSQCLYLVFKECDAVYHVPLWQHADGSVEELAVPVEDKDPAVAVPIGHKDNPAPRHGDRGRLTEVGVVRPGDKGLANY